jgi:ferredoxin
MNEMWEANLTFKREEREGVVPVGSYLSDAAGRLGIRPERKCVPFENVHFCKVSILEGRNLLSPQTAHETEYLSAEQGAADERLGCQTKNTEPGDIVIMTTETKEEKAEVKAEEAGKEYTKEFAELPLEKKIAQLVQLEAIALGETVSFVINSPFLIFDKAMEVMAQFGMKKEEQGKKATRPAEHVAEAEKEKPDEKANNGA